MFVYKRYIFKYQIHAVGDSETQSSISQADNPQDAIEYTYSFFIKINQKTTAIWQYHKFSDELLS